MKEEEEKSRKKVRVHVAQTVSCHQHQSATGRQVGFGRLQVGCR